MTGSDGDLSSSSCSLGLDTLEELGRQCFSYSIYAINIRLLLTFDDVIRLWIYVSMRVDHVDGRIES